MGQDFSCDYLVDITGLVDNGENPYSCYHPSGVMCGKEDCPVVIDYNRRCLKDTEASDYDGLAHGKLCPLKANQPPVLGIWNLDPAPDLAETLKVGVIKCRSDGEPPRVEYIGGRCDGSRCAWWDADKNRCAVLSIARNK